MQNDRDYKKEALHSLWESGDVRLLEALEQNVCGPLSDSELSMKLQSLAGNEMCRLEEQRENDIRSGEPEDLPNYPQ